MLRTLTGADLNGKRVLIRVDYNVPLLEGRISDNTRIKATIPTLKAILKMSPKRVIILSHLGRPKGQVKSEFSLSPVRKELEKLIGEKVAFVDAPIGQGARAAIENSSERLVLMENIRFYKDEEQNDPAFSKSLASLGDYFVCDAFGCAHRAHSSVVGVCNYLPSCAGLLLENEVKNLSKVLSSPDHPFVAIIGGAKVSSKIGVLNSLVGKADTIIIGGAMAYTFLSLEGVPVGRSLVESEAFSLAREFLSLSKVNGTKVVLPVDSVCAPSPDDTSRIEVSSGGVPSDLMGLDVGPESRKIFGEVIKGAKTVFWNGPVGFSEAKEFEEGTAQIAEAVSKVKGFTVAGGGDSVAAINKLGYNDKFSFISTGGGASLEFISGIALPGVVALSD